MNRYSLNHYAFLKLLDDPYYTKFPEELPNCIFTSEEQCLKDKEEYEALRSEEKENKIERK